MDKELENSLTSLMDELAECLDRLGRGEITNKEVKEIIKKAKESNKALRLKVTELKNRTR